MNRKALNVPQILLDVVCMFIIYIAAIKLVSTIFHPVPLLLHLWIPILYSLVFVFTMFACKVYHRSTFTYEDRTLKYIMRACLFGVLFCMTMVPFITRDPVLIDIVFAYVLISLVVLPVEYLIVQELRLSLGNRFYKHIVLIGPKENIQEYLYYLKKTSFKVDVAGSVILDEYSVPVEKSHEEIDVLLGILRKRPVDEVIFALPSNRMEEVRQYMNFCKDRGLTVRLAVDFFENSECRSYAYTIGTIPVFACQTSMLTDLQSYLKRSVDITGALIGLLVALPVSAFLIPILRLKGSDVLERRTYFSVNRRPFTLYRFKVAAENGTKESFAKKITRTGLNNLPMFWNVLKGHMSLVGGLPVAASDLTAQSDKEYRNITVKPGLTGIWRFTDPRNLEKPGIILDLELEYIRRWSLVKDLWLIVKTLAIILTAKSSQTSLFSCIEGNRSYNITYSLQR